MRAAHGDPDVDRGAAARAVGLAAGSGMPVAPMRVHGRAVRGVAERAQRLVGERRRDERDAERQPVAWKPAGTAIAARSSRFMKLV